MKISKSVQKKCTVQCLHFCIYGSSQTQHHSVKDTASSHRQDVMHPTDTMTDVQHAVAPQLNSWIINLTAFESSFNSDCPLAPFGLSSRKGDVHHPPTPPSIHPSIPNPNKHAFTPTVIPTDNLESPINET